MKRRIFLGFVIVSASLVSVLQGMERQIPAVAKDPEELSDADRTAIRAGVRWERASDAERDVLFARGARSIYHQLYYAITHNNLPLVKALVETGYVNLARETSESFSWVPPLILAAPDGSPEIIKYLISQGASVTAKDKLSRTPLLVAKRAERTEIVDILEKAGA